MHSHHFVNVLLGLRWLQTFLWLTCNLGVYVGAWVPPALQTLFAGHLYAVNFCHPGSLPLPFDRPIVSGFRFRALGWILSRRPILSVCYRVVAPPSPIYVSVLHHILKAFRALGNCPHLAVRRPAIAPSPYLSQISVL